MDIVLPKEIGYSPSLPALPECISQDIVIAPSNNSKFGAGDLIQFDLNSRGFLDPSSVYIRYKVKLTNAGTEESVLRACPAYVFFGKLETIFGSTVVENITNYGQVCNLWVNCQMDIAMKYGLQNAYGWTGSDNTGFDSRTCTTSQGDLSFAVPLPCLLSQAEKLVPLGLMPNVRIQLTVDSLSNMFAVTGAYKAATAVELTNVELCYTMIDFAGGVNDIVKNMGEQFYIKSTSFQNAGANLNTVAAGSSLELVYNLRLASIKSMFALFCKTGTVNGVYDSIDITSTKGELSFNIAGTSYPSRPISTRNNKSAVLMELKKAFGALHSESYNFSINAVEFSYVDADSPSATQPGKFIFGVNTEKLSTNGALLTGISTQNSPITLRITCGEATSAGYTVYLIAMYDALISVDPHNRNAVVKQ